VACSVAEHGRRRTSLAIPAVRAYDGLARTSPRDSQQLVESLHGQLARALRAWIAPAIVLAALALGPADARADHVDCGQRITRDVRLDADLLNCRGNGLTVAADGITIDLGGHTVDGVGRGVGVFNGQWGDGHRDVTIRNGTVRGFKVGVRSGARETRVYGLAVMRNAAGGIALRSRECRVERSIVTDNGYGHGIFVGGVSGCHVIGNRVSGHLGAGIEASRSRAHVIERNRVWDNRQAGILLAGTAGVRVARNAVNSNDGPGIWLFDGATANQVLDNTLAANVRGIQVTLDGAGNLIDGNTVSGSVESGIRLAGTAAGNTLTDNLVVLSGMDGIGLAESPDARVERNSVHDNRRDGIFVTASGAALIANTASHNGDDGIDVEDGIVSLLGNVTERNGDLGIEAPAAQP
jgi:parallel beta-helix repeat protein